MNPLSTCDLCDALRDDAGQNLRVLPPPWAHFGGVAAFHGTIATLRCHEDNTLVRAALEEPGQGRVLVVDGGGSLRTALVGGKLAALAARNGWAGIVVDGAVRDAAELAACAVGIVAAALCPMPPAKRGAGQRDGPVQLRGVAVRPGQFLVADADGVIVLERAP
ncbi:MAG TPA: ribonuclease E activity regulator RraA [Burkholderiaceae bacterium]|nr:ribonuclease E activity regulator RraA [Burkholderiaceae bacterium]